MKNLQSLIYSLVISISCSNVMAQNPVDNAAPRTATDPETLETTYFFSTSQDSTFLKNAIKNQNGSYTIKANQQSDEANALNREICAVFFDATDATNDTDVTLGPSTLHAGICIAPVLSHNSMSTKPRQSPTWPIALPGIDIPCFSTSTGASDNATGNSIGYASCNTSMGTYSACFGDSCNAFQDWPGEK